MSIDADTRRTAIPLLATPDVLAAHEHAAEYRSGGSLHYATGTPLSPTSCQHAYKSAVLALGLTSYPPNPQARAQHGAVIAIPDAVVATAATVASALIVLPFCMPGRWDRI